VHNEIHNIKKLCEVFKVVAKSSQRAKGWQRAHFVLDQTTNGTLEAQTAECPSVEAWREHRLA